LAVRHRRLRNAVNLTDGLDGLAIVPVMIAAYSRADRLFPGNVLYSRYLLLNHVPTPAT